ncbi:MAG: polar amino acid transport system substrate-binding protein [Candidatus Omnitrophota bacterium]|jgi:polar amino acid transport system substrate-binding protein
MFTAKFKLITIMFLGWMLIVSSSCFAEEKKVIRLATLVWEPYVGEELKEYGLTSEIMKIAFENLGYEVQFNFMPWVRCLKDTEEGIYDGCYPAYTTKERAVTYEISKSILSSPLVFYKRMRDDIVYDTLEGLSDYNIGVVRGYVNGEAFDSAEYLNKVEGRSDEINVKKLLWERLDLIVVDDFIAKDIMNRLFEDRVNEIGPLEPPLQVKTLHLLLSKKLENYEELIQAFDSEIEKMNIDGTLDKIKSKHGF